ncbi:hypothetical protein ACH4E9_07260 [Streptomyces anulatus]|uniref:hypothetical protein n=1 Tax=Streptomyces anulatus TaxID=1892 RepID=UPI002256DF91|nr:hypothetical protein [Streptomyces anulatus]MCX4503842.1 hypothetical protein [Streptomyces anulatus]
MGTLWITHADQECAPSYAPGTYGRTPRTITAVRPAAGPRGRAKGRMYAERLT